MATVTLQSGNYSSYLYMDYTFTSNATNRTWSLSGSMKFYSGTASMGAWGNFGTTKLGPLTANIGLPAVAAATHTTLIGNGAISSGSYAASGAAPSVAVAWSWGANSSWGGYTLPSGTVTVTGSAIANQTAPSAVSTSVVSSDRTSITFGSSITGTCTLRQRNLNGGGWVDVSGTSGNITIGSLSPNTSYTFQLRANQNGGAYTTSGTVTGKTTANAPAIGVPTSAPTRTGCTITCTATADTNVTISSYTTYYRVNGTSTYSSVDGKVISGLQPNTVYQYYVRATDSLSKTVDTGVYTFTTTGNNPSITSVSANTTISTAVLTQVVTYDTNASYSSVAINYGITTSYGSSSTSFSLSGLQSNTTYYYSMIIKDNWGRASSAFTGNFKTKAKAPVFNKMEVSDVTINSAKLTFVAVPDTNATISKYELYDEGNILIDTQTSGIFNVVGLSPGTEYLYYSKVYDNTGNVTTSGQIYFVTLPQNFVHMINNKGEVVSKTIYAVGEPKNFVKHIKIENGGIAFAVGRSYEVACSYSTSTTSMRSELISIPMTTLGEHQACFLKSNYNWKLQYYDKNKLGISQQTGNAGEGALISFSDLEGYFAIEIESLNKDDIIKETKMYGCGSGDYQKCMNDTYKIKKLLIPTDIVKVSKFMRYIDVGQSGNSINVGNHISELEVYDVDGVNRALGVMPTIIKGNLTTTLTAATDGNTASNPYVGLNGVSSRNLDTILRFDLGAVYEIDYARLWRYYADNRYYKKTFLYGRNDKKELCYKFHDYIRDGLYYETSNGLYVKVNKAPVDTSIPIINSFTANTSQWTNQGVILTILAEDNLGVENLIYSFDGGINWTKNNKITVFKNQIYTAIVKDKSGNISITNPAINVTNVDLVPPTIPYIELKYDNKNGELYNEGWTNKDICVDIKTQSSPNICPNDIEPGYIDRDTGKDIPDYKKHRVYSEMKISGPDIYIGRYGNISGIATIYCYDINDEYIDYIDIAENVKDILLSLPSNTDKIRLADTIGDLDNLYMIAFGSNIVPYEPYYIVEDNLSGIKGWYYKLKNDNEYFSIIPGTIIKDNAEIDYLVVTRDNAGNNSAYKEISILIDKCKPVNPRFGYTKTINSLILTASGVDNFSGIRGYQFSIDGGETWTEEQASNIYTFSNINGMCKATIKLLDMAGNEAISEFLAIYVGSETDYPVITGIIGNPINWTNQNVELEINSRIGTGSIGGTTIAEYSSDNGRTWQNNNKFTFTENQLVHFLVKDSNGKISETYIIDIQKIDKEPPILIIPEEEITISIGVDYDLMMGVSYYDNDSGINENGIVIVPNSTATLPVGENLFTYTITDNAGNITSKSRIIYVYGLVPSDRLYPSDELYPEDYPLPNKDLETYSHRRLGLYKNSDIKGGSI